MSVSCIIPCAGKSTRFSNKPKWLRTCPNGNLMIQESIRGLDLTNVDNVYICFLKEHIDTYLNGINLHSLFSFTNKNIHVMTIDHHTSSQCETVYNILQHFCIKGAIFIKDCDNHFTHKIIDGNYVCGLRVNNDNPISEIHNKSFVEINSTDEIMNICEKCIISDKICVGGYSFSDSNIFIDCYLNCSKNNNITKNELYISHIIYKCILEHKAIFNFKEITNYIDWGTEIEWDKYTDQFKTLFVDIDGTLFYNSGEYSALKWGENKPIEANIQRIKELYRSGKVQIFLTTARKSEYKEVTLQQLKKYDVPYDNIIFGLFHCKRYLINDYSNTNKYPSCMSINLKRDSSTLSDFI